MTDVKFFKIDLSLPVWLSCHGLGTGAIVFTRMLCIVSHCWLPLMWASRVDDRVSGKMFERAAIVGSAPLCKISITVKAPDREYKLLIPPVVLGQIYKTVV